MMCVVAASALQLLCAIAPSFVYLQLKACYSCVIMLQENTYILLTDCVVHL